MKIQFFPWKTNRHKPIGVTKKESFFLKFQIALTDLLKSIKLEPDGLIGHSFGEIICGYADNCLNKKQVLLAAYYRGLASTETNTLRALMAVIGMISTQMFIRNTKIQLVQPTTF